MENILEVENLCKGFSNGDFALDKVSFSIPYGSIMGFVGENGAGKTTTISCILNTIGITAIINTAFGPNMSSGQILLWTAIMLVCSFMGFAASYPATTTIFKRKEY